MLRALLAMTAISLCGCPSEPAPPPPAAPAPPQTKPKERPPIVPVTKRPDPNAHESHGPPDFVKRGSGVFEDGGKRWFYGTGKASGIDNMMKAHVLADRAANAELLNQMRKYNQRAIDILGFDVRTKVDNFAVAEVEKAQIVDHWIDHDGDAWHSLRRLDADLYAEDLAKLLAADEALKQKLGRPELTQP